jgi:hypothetical protein
MLKINLPNMVNYFFKKSGAVLEMEKIPWMVYSFFNKRMKKKRIQSSNV